MSFAQKELSKYGWKSGDGLGRTGSGMATPLKVDIKMNANGVGHATKEFAWWDHCFNKVANNIVVDHDAAAGEVKVGRKREEQVERRTRPPIKEAKTLFYSGFVAAKVGLGGNASSSEEDEETKIHTTNLTEEELLAACGGRTGHKAARHGLSLTGKLARIADQEGRSSTFSTPVQSDSDTEEKPLLAKPEVVKEEVEDAEIARKRAKKDKKEKKRAKKEKERLEKAAEEADSSDDEQPASKKDRKRKSADVEDAAKSKKRKHVDEVEEKADASVNVKKAKKEKRSGRGEKKEKKSKSKKDGAVPSDSDDE